jgi:CheY-like chemotaxis protein
MAEKREGAERRRRPRGGRRPEDLRGFTPLVMVVDSEVRRREISEAILAKLMFAVAPVESAEKAVALLNALNPEVIVAGEQDARKIRQLMPIDTVIAIVAVGENARVTDALIESVRDSLRGRLPSA